MKLYHGSTVIVKNPSIRQGRANTDFWQRILHYN